MKAIKMIFHLMQYIALFIVGYYGIKYTFIASSIFLGNVWSDIIPFVVTALFINYIIRKEV